MHDEILTGDLPDKRAAIDLARLEDGRLDLFELKWMSNTPLFAAFEFFLYGLSYLFCRARKSEFGYSELKTMQAHHVTLNVFAPRKYYENLDLICLQNGLDAGFREIAKAKLVEPITTGFRFLTLPDGFEAPFATGRQVIDECSVAVPGQRARMLLNAVNNIAPLYPISTST